MKKTILELVEEYGLDIHKEGNILRALCPFHNDTGKPNFTVYSETDSWFCFACNEGGDIISFVSKIEKISREEAKSRLTDSNVDLEELQQKIDGIDSESKKVTSFNVELDVLISQHCKKYLLQNPQKLRNVLDYLKQFDNLLFTTISYEKMQTVIQEVNQKFSLKQDKKVDV